MCCKEWPKPRAGRPKLSEWLVGGGSPLPGKERKEQNMKTWMKVLSCALVLSVVALGIVGCQTYGEAAGLGGAIGAGTGAIIGHQSGHTVEGALIGGALGAVTGLIVHDVKVKQARSREQTAQVYNYQPTQGEMLTLERSEVLPPSVRPGEEISGTIQYALLGTGPGVQVGEQRTIMQGERVVADISTQNFTRQDGTWVSTLPFRLPGNIQPGQYSLVTTVRTARSAISGRANFTVL